MWKTKIQAGCSSDQGHDPLCRMCQDSILTTRLPGNWETLWQLSWIRQISIKCLGCNKFSIFRYKWFPRTCLDWLAVLLGSARHSKRQQHEKSEEPRALRLGYLPRMWNMKVQASGLLESWFPTTQRNVLTAEHSLKSAKQLHTCWGSGPLLGCCYPCCSGLDLLQCKNFPARTSVWLVHSPYLPSDTWASLLR